MKNFDQFDESTGLNEEFLFEGESSSVEPRPKTKSFNDFVNEYEGTKDEEKQKMVDAGEFRIYLGNKAAVALFMNDIKDTPAARWVDQRSDTEVRVVLTKDVDQAYELSGALRTRGLIPQDYNSLEESDMSAYHSIGKKRYNEMLEALPPIYVDEVDGMKVSGFAVSEPSSERQGIPTFTVCFKQGEKYYEKECTLKNADGEDITFRTYNDHEFSRGNKAITAEKK